jgi:ribosomal protein L15E
MKDEMKGCSLSLPTQSGWGSDLQTKRMIEWGWTKKMNRITGSTRVRRNRR